MVQGISIFHSSMPGKFKFLKVFKYIVRFDGFLRGRRVKLDGSTTPP